MNTLVKRFFLYFFLFIVVSYFSHATHIVGGQLEAKHIDGNRYEVKLVLFFDSVLGDPKSKDSTIQVAAYQKVNNRIIDFFDLHLRSDNPVPYTNPACQVGNLKTEALVYMDTIQFRDAKYTDSQGFYLVWERCCRNASTRNIVIPNQTGTVFYIELPPVTISNYNSSPSFKSIVGDYGCTKRLFKMDFSATDVDGDSLVYRLATPLAGGTSIDAPSSFPSPAPFKLITWASGFSASEMIQGVLPLQIDATLGELQVIATQPGLYAFAVVCEEYRNQTKIGEVRREFQLPIITCPIKPGPKMHFADELVTKRKDTIDFKLGTQVCRNFIIEDTILNTPLNFKIRYPPNTNTSSASLSSSNYLVTALADTTQLSFCINGFLKATSKPYEYRVVVNDDACSTPNTDTLSWFVNVKDTLVKPTPVVITPLPDSGIVKPNDPVVIVIEVPPTDQIDSSCKAKIEVSVSGVEMKGNVQVTTVGNKTTITWLPNCSISEDSTITFKVFVGDLECITPYRDSTQVKFRVKDLNQTKNKPIPNIITPNGDPFNEDFAVSDYLFETCKGGFEWISIYNRWGTLIYESKEYQFRWKGVDAPDGIYYYALKYQNKIINGYIIVAR